jgi:hypothetical protein
MGSRGVCTQHLLAQGMVGSASDGLPGRANNLLRAHQPLLFGADSAKGISPACVLSGARLQHWDCAARPDAALQTDVGSPPLYMPGPHCADHRPPQNATNGSRCREGSRPHTHASSFASATAFMCVPRKCLLCLFLGNVHGMRMLCPDMSMSTSLATLRGQLGVHCTSGVFQVGSS